MYHIDTYDGVIFDLDGTLVDSMGVWRKIDYDFLGKRGLKVPEDYLEKITPLGYEAAAEYTISRFGFDEKPEDLIKEWYSMAIDAYANDVILKKGAKEYLHYLIEHDKKLSVATASDLELAVPVLKNNGVYDLFDNITTVREVQRGKGFPDIYNCASTKMKLDNDKCIVFEDIIAGIQGAKQGNYRTIGVFDQHSHEDIHKLRDISDYFIYDFKECIS